MIGGVLVFKFSLIQKLKGNSFLFTVYYVIESI